MSCERCPCPDICLARPSFCAVAAQESPDPVELRHICGRSAIARGIPPPTYPSVVTMAANVVGAVARFVASGLVMVDQAELERRLGICRGCEHFDPQPERCRVCGCVAAWKARLASEHCPLPKSKW